MPARPAIEAGKGQLSARVSNKIDPYLSACPSTDALYPR